MAFAVRASLAAAAFLLLCTLCASQPVIQIDSSDQMMPAMLQDVGDLFDALDAEFRKSGDSQQSGSRGQDDFDSFSFDGPQDQYLPVHFQLNSPRFFQLPSLGGFLSGLRSVAPQPPKPISAPMRMLSELDFSPARQSGVSMSSVSVEHRDGKTIRTETSYGADGSEHTTRTVTEDEPQAVPNGFDLNEMMEAFEPRAQGDNSDENSFTSDLADVLQLFDLDLSSGLSSGGSQMPCDMDMDAQDGSSPQRLSNSRIYSSDEYEEQPTPTVQVMLIEDLSEEEAKDLAARMGLGSLELVESPNGEEDEEERQEEDEEPASDEEDEEDAAPKRSVPISAEEAEAAVKESLAAMNVKPEDLPRGWEKKLSQKIAASLQLDPEEVAISTGGADDDEEEQEEQEEDEEPRDEEKDSDDEGEVQKLAQEVTDEEEAMHQVKERVANTKLALDDEADEEKYELLEAKDDAKRAEAAAKAAREAEKKKTKDVNFLQQMEQKLSQLSSVH